MDSTVLKNILTTNQKIPHLMIFVENEPINARAYIDLIGKKLNLPVKIYDTADNALYDMYNDLFEDRIYYILNDDAIIKKNQYIANLNTEHYVIVGFDGVKIPDNFLDNNSQFVYVFNKGDMNSLIGYIKKKYSTVQTTDNNLRQLIEWSDYKLSQINNELDKIKLLSVKEQEQYFSNVQYPDIRPIDNMDVMQMVLNKDKAVFNYLNILIDTAVTSLLALNTMARKRFIKTNDKYYAKIMILCFKAHSSIIDGTLSSENAVKKFVIDLIQ